MARCEAEYRAARHATMVFLACDLDKSEHAGLNHHDGIYGIWWRACTLEDHGHAAAGEREPIPWSPAEADAIRRSQSANARLPGPGAAPIGLDWPFGRPLSAAQP